MRQIEAFIWYVNDEDVEQNLEDEYPDTAIELGGPGYYFEDENENLSGPYDSLEEAKNALESYQDEL